MLRNLDVDYDSNDGGEYSFLTLSSPEELIQIGFEPEELSLLLAIPETDWAERRTIAAGRSAGLAAHWYRSESPAAAMVSFGPDPESSPIGVVLTAATLDRLLALAADPHTSE